MNKIAEAEFEQLFVSARPFIDVRAEVEFTEGHLPNAQNLPILNNEERAIIGTTYKKSGQQAAVQLGYQIVSGENKEEKLKKWSNFLDKNPDAVLYCFRGGKRSQITQGWLQELGYNIPIIEGGFKKSRKFLISQFGQSKEKASLLLISGVTGSAKSRLLRSLKPTAQVVDLEEIANHRGSAFGYVNKTPTQINFENKLAIALIKQFNKIKISENNIILIEDESRLIGPSIIPDVFFKYMRESEVILIEEGIEFRINEIYQDYILEPILNLGSQIFQRHLDSLNKIQKKLGGLRFQEIKQDILSSIKEYEELGTTISNKIWIEKLLNYYYDPIYLKSLQRRNIKKKFAGTFLECQHFLNSLF